MSEPIFAAIGTAVFFAVLLAWVPLLDSIVRIVALLKRHRTMAKIDPQVFLPEVQVP